MKFVRGTKRDFENLKLKSQVVFTGVESIYLGSDDKLYFVLEDTYLKNQIKNDIINIENKSKNLYE